MSNTELTVLNNNQAVAVQGGLGLDLSSRFFRLKPATITINQPNTQAEGALKGHLRVAESGDQFLTMTVAMLQMPREFRQYYEGAPGEMNRSSENLMCSAREVKRDRFNKELQGPDDNAKVPQSVRCANCPQQDWTKWRNNKVKENIPKCESNYYALFIDTIYQMPLQMFIRSKSKEPFEKGMENLTRTFMKMQAQNLNPNIFDISFTLSTKQITTGKYTSYILQMSDFKAITPEQREKFGEVFAQFSNQGNRSEEENAQAEAESQIEYAGKTIDAALTGDVIDAETII